jgi:hypothetical protein
MAIKKPFAGLGSEGQLQTIAHWLAFIAAAWPRLDPFKRVKIDGSEVTQPVNGTVNVGTVTTVSAVTAVNNMGSTLLTARPLDHAPVAFGNMGALHLYDNIKVTR